MTEPSHTIDPETERPTFVPFRGTQDTLFGDVALPPDPPKPEPAKPEAAEKPARKPRAPRLCGKCRGTIEAPASACGGTGPELADKSATDGQRDTSAAARESVKDRTEHLRVLVLNAIRKARGATCDRLEVLLGLTHQTCSARVHDLMKAGQIEDSGARKPTRSGRPAIVWRIPKAPKT